MRSVQTFTMNGTRVQRRVAKLRLALLPVRLSEISKLVVPPHLNFLCVPRACAEGSEQTEPLHYEEENIIKDMQLHKVISSTQENPGQNKSW